MLIRADRRDPGEQPEGRLRDGWAAGRYFQGRTDSSGKYRNTLFVIKKMRRTTVFVT